MVKKLKNAGQKPTIILKNVLRIFEAEIFKLFKNIQDIQREPKNYLTFLYKNRVRIRTRCILAEARSVYNFRASSSSIVLEVGLISRTNKTLRNICNYSFIS